MSNHHAKDVSVPLRLRHWHCLRPASSCARAPDSQNHGVQIGSPVVNLIFVMGGRSENGSFRYVSGSHFGRMRTTRQHAFGLGFYFPNSDQVSHEIDLPSRSVDWNDPD